MKKWRGWSMKVFVLNKGQKSLFYVGDLDKDMARQIKLWLREYFGWRRIRVIQEGGEVYLMNADEINRHRKLFFKKKEGVVA